MLFGNVKTLIKLSPSPYIRVLHYHLLKSSEKQACRNKSTSLMPKLTILISTFQIECIIKFIIHISVTPTTASVTGWRKALVVTWQTEHSVFIYPSLQHTHTNTETNKCWQWLCNVVSSVPSICYRSAFNIAGTKLVSYLHGAGRRLFSEQQGKQQSPFVLVLTFLVESSR